MAWRPLAGSETTTADHVEAGLRRGLCIPIVGTDVSRTAREIDDLKQAIDDVKPANTEFFMPPRLWLDRDMPNRPRNRVTVFRCRDRCDKNSIRRQGAVDIVE